MRIFHGVLPVTVGLATAVSFLAPGVPAQQPSAAGKIDYNWQVRPILSENCFRCHGPDANKRQAGLRLDRQESAYAQAVTPGKPEESELLNRVASQDPSYRMPPPQASAKSLTNPEIEILRNWIKEGAEYKPHWAFIAPVKARAPAENAIDYFVGARLRQERLRPSPEANRETLINRVTLQLTGLPPALAEVDAYLADKSRNAYEKVVDRLLASPAYGEHMAAYWMNIARYSESDGFLDDHHDRMFWPYRDWVISAFNKNMPFDQFSTVQIAGDLFPNATKEQKLATAFLRVGKRTSENGSIDEEYRVEYALDRANVIGGGFLALTTGCARCHDHKYDPIAQKEYYSLSGFFNSTDEPGFFAPGYTTATGGPTIQWTTNETEAKLSAANVKIKNAEMAEAAVRKAARLALTSGVAELLKRPASEIAGAVQKSVQSATVAYYPFEKTEALPGDQLPVSRSATEVPAGLVTLDKRKRGTAFAEAFPGVAAAAGKSAAGEFEQKSIVPRKLPNSMIRENLLASPAGMPGVPPAVLEEANLRPGKVGNALWFTDTNRGFLGKGVGDFERTQPFSIDLWIYPASEYENSQVINHRDDDNSGGAGYKLNLERNRLSFFMMRTDHVNHDPAAKFLHTGFQLAGRPPEGAWVNYALGSENQNLPAFVAFTSGTFSGVSHDASNWGSGLLPSQYQGVPFRAGKDPVLYIGNPQGMTLAGRRSMLDVIGKLSEAEHQASGDPEIPAKISQYEMAYRMMTSVPEVADISSEPESVLEMYGPDVRKPGTFARNCSLARRLAERDVRFISVMHVGWDHHSNIAALHPPDCRTVDQPSAALVADLKQRGLLKDTLVANSGARLLRKASWTRTRGAITTVIISLGGLQAVVSSRVSRTERQTTSATTLSPLPSKSTICTRRCCMF